jgi:ABC-type branched-subunit amino acid transport system ATPase component
MLELHSISKSFSGITAADHVSFSARPGEMTVESIFSQLVVEQDTTAISREIADRARA